MNLKESLSLTHFDGQLLISKVDTGISSAGKSYLNMVLQDNSASIDAKKWEVTEEDSLNVKSGRIFNVVGEILQYKGRPQLKVTSMVLIPEDGVNHLNFALPCPVNIEELRHSFKKYQESIKDPEYSLIVDAVIKKHYTELVSFPAAATFHHAYLGGILHHTTTMATVASSLASIYPDVNYDLLMSGVLLHDVCKTRELSGIIAPHYTLEGKLLGHISMIAQEVLEAAHDLEISGEKPILLAHLLLSHHGKMEFGSPVVPELKEALLLHFVDDLDAKMNMVDKALDETLEGEFTQRIIAFNGTCFYRPRKD